MKKGTFLMNKLILTLTFIICAYFTSPIQSAQASERHSTASKHHIISHKSRHHSKLSKSNHHSTVSWYGSGFHGKKTASGEKYNMYAMTAAHRTLPLLSYAEVTNLKNHRSVIVRINDRGPFHGKRDMDLSYSAAKKLGIRGTGSVKITPLGSNQALFHPQS